MINVSLIKTKMDGEVRSGNGIRNALRWQCVGRSFTFQLLWREEEVHIAAVRMNDGCRQMVSRYFWRRVDKIRNDIWIWKELRYTVKSFERAIRVWIPTLLVAGVSLKAGADVFVSKNEARPDRKKSPFRTVF